jgi:hypothetical protein
MVELMDQYAELKRQIADYGWLDKHTAEERWYPLLGQIAAYVEERGYGR